MSILLRRAFITVPPLVLAGVLLMHPNDEGDTIYESVRPVVYLLWQSDWRCCGASVRRPANVQGPDPGARG